MAALLAMMAGVLFVGYEVLAILFDWMFSATAMIAGTALMIAGIAGASFSPRSNIGGG